MVNLLAVGVASPSGAVSDELIRNLCRQRDDAAEVVPLVAGVQRPTVLDDHYLRATGNADIWQSLNNLTTTPSKLGAEASVAALEEAGLPSEKIGLILGDSVSPLETCPSEASRVGNILGIKVPAFDVIGLSGALPLFFHTLLSRKPEKLPEVILCVSTNCVTPFISYVQGRARWFFGDYAVACLLSPTIEGDATIADANFFSGARADAATPVQPVYSPLLFSPEEQKRREARFMDRLQSHLGPGAEPFRLVVPPGSGGGEVLSSPQFDGRAEPAECGYAFGAAAGLALGQVLASVSAGEACTFGIPGVGDSAGFFRIVSKRGG